MSLSPPPKKTEGDAEGINTYSLEFVIEAKKELTKLDKALQVQLLKKLKSRLSSPRVPSAKLRNMPDCYKIKLRASGVRLVYEVVDQRLVVLVLGVGRREDCAVYLLASKRIQ